MKEIIEAYFRETYELQRTVTDMTRLIEVDKQLAEKDGRERRLEFLEKHCDAYFKKLDQHINVIANAGLSGEYVDFLATA